MRKIFIALLLISILTPKIYTLKKDKELQQQRVSLQE